MCITEFLLYLFPEYNFGLTMKVNALTKRKSAEITV